MLSLHMLHLDNRHVRLLCSVRQQQRRVRSAAVQGGSVADPPPTSSLPLCPVHFDGQPPHRLLQVSWPNILTPNCYRPTFRPPHCAACSLCSTATSICKSSPFPTWCGNTSATISSWPTMRSLSSRLPSSSCATSTPSSVCVARGRRKTLTGQVRVTSSLVLVFFNNRCRLSLV